MAQKYKKYTHLEHILARPDTYIGSLIPDVSSKWLYNETTGLMEECETSHVGGLFKIFDEILVNAVDQCVVADSLVDKITVDVDVKDGSVSIMNTGEGVPVEQHPDHDNIWVPELIFGELLTSSNYNDSDSRITGGRNGYGAKLANVFSKRFIVETACIKNNKKYVQEWTENMTKKSKAKITAWNVKKPKGYTRITFWPDLSRFNMNSLAEDDIARLFERRTFDACACTPANVKVVYNGKALPTKSFERYVDLYIGDKKQSTRVFEMSDDKRWEIAVAQSSSGFKQVSFVNGIHTSLGGTHVDYVLNQLVKKLTDVIQGKHKDLKVKPQHIKDHVMVFVRSTLINPTFSSQTKTECTSRWKDFGTFYRMSDDFVKRVTKLGFVDDIVSLVKHREMRELNKTDGRKMSVIRGIPKLEDANKAGTAQSSKCTLILTEGDSAKTFAISGLGVVGRDYYGVFPLRGKLLNVRDATAKQLLGNEEIVNMKQILGLQMNKEYTSVSELRYGKVMILTDADVDGSHIKGLFINFIHHFWPSLLNNAPGFLISMRTPILKCTRGASTLSFYTKPEYDLWKQTQAANVGNWSIKYYKGLGTSTANEAKEYFRNMGSNMVSYTYSASTDDKNVQLAFKKTLANDRKEWIQEGTRDKSAMCLDPAKNTISVTDFIHKDLRWFSIADNERSIPSVVDGFKPSQRKVLFACRKRTSNSDTKVSQLSGFVSSETCYHHGEQSLMSTIVGMAQDYVGSNGINLLSPNGQFGTRLMGGKDAASPRYIFTNLQPSAYSLFHKDDDPILTYVEDDGTTVEPEFFVPVLPMVLINGADGIGTGYSTHVPCYNPSEVRDNVMRCIRNQPILPMTPWYKGFQGRIVQNPDDSTKYVTHGVWHRTSDTVIEVTELPIGKWTSDYKEYLDSQSDGPIIKTFENHSTDTEVHFIIKLTSADFTPEQLQKMLKLTSTLSIANMHLFDHHGSIAHYASTTEIIEAFVRVRLRYYKKRKTHLLKVFNETLHKDSERIRFIRLVIDNTIVVFRRNREDIRRQMLTHGFAEDTHEILLAIRLSSFTEENIARLEKNIRECTQSIRTLEKSSLQELWTDDLNNVLL